MMWVVGKGPVAATPLKEQRKPRHPPALPGALHGRAFGPYSSPTTSRPRALRPIPFQHFTYFITLRIVLLQHRASPASRHA